MKRMLGLEIFRSEASKTQAILFVYLGGVSLASVMRVEGGGRVMSE